MMTTPSNENLSNSPRSRPSSLRRVRRGKDNVMNSPNSRPNSQPSSRPSSRPTSRPVSPTRSFSSSFINSNDGNEEPIIPTAIVIKNIPFSVKKDALLNIFASMNIPTAYAFNYHFDNGVFRGLAFANYKTPEETEIVVNAVNGLDIGGRKLRVEYKKMLPTDNDDNKTKERDSSLSKSTASVQQQQQQQQTTGEDNLDLNDPSVLELYSYILLFRSDPDSTEIALPKTFSAKERRDAHLIADRLGLAHYSEGYGNDRQVIIEKRGSVPAPIVRLQNKSSRGNLRSSPSRERLNMSNSSTTNNNSSSSSDTKRDTYRKSMMSTSTTAEALNAAISNVILPIRQPRGPEPGKNFASQKLARGAADDLADTLSKQHLNSN